MIFWCHFDGTLHDVDDDVTSASVKIDGLNLSVDVIGGIVPQNGNIYWKKETAEGYITVFQNTNR